MPIKKKRSDSFTGSKDIPSPIGGKNQGENFIFQSPFIFFISLFECCNDLR